MGRRMCLGGVNEVRANQIFVNIIGNCNPFHVVLISNGVRQGGNLSPKLFSVYMDDPSNMLIRSGVGCYIDNVCVNIVFYADDLCLMAPCAIALQEVLNICHSYSIIVDFNFNAKKSFCFCIYS